MRFSVEIKGINELNSKMKKLSKLSETEPLIAITAALHDIRSTAVKNIAKNTDGRPQMRYNPKREVNVSNPFDYPNSDTGDLIKSIEVEIDTAKMEGRVGSNLKHAVYLEFGTKDMAPRPWLGIAMRTNQEKIQFQMKEVLKKMTGFLK
jgi:HK97 gp10 family phage protein